MAKKTNVIPFRGRKSGALTNPAALTFLRDRGTVVVPTWVALAELWSWDADRVRKAIQAWAKRGTIKLMQDKVAKTITIIAPPAEWEGRPGKTRDSKPETRRRRTGKASGAERLMILIAAGLSGTCAFMSVSGFVVMVPGAPTCAMIFGYLAETAKFVGAGIISSGWKSYSWLSKMVFGALLAVAAVINAAGVYGFLISNHAGPAALRAAVFTERDAGEGAKLEVAQGKLADLDKRLSLIDGASEGAAKRGKANSAMNAIAEQKKARAGIAAERERVAQEVASLKAGRNTMAAHHQGDEAATLPVRYSALLFEDFGWLKPGGDPERLWRWLAFLILMTGDPIALAAMFMINSRHRKVRAA
jgi:hypothetical protein